ncbi:MAG: DUF167 domain-containing protein [Candidatus Micrarchaeia archaeon]
MGHLTLKVTPGSKKPEIKLIDNGAISLHRSNMANEAAIAVRLCERAQENKANIALIKLLSRLSGFKVRLIAGANNRIKTVEFDCERETFLKNITEALEAKKA